jgi:hypothetical protein
LALACWRRVACVRAAAASSGPKRARIRVAAANDSGSSSDIAASRASSVMPKGSRVPDTRPLLRSRGTYTATGRATSALARRQTGAEFAGETLPSHPKTVNVGPGRVAVSPVSHQDLADRQRRVGSDVEGRRLAARCDDLGSQDRDHGAIVGAEAGPWRTQRDPVFGRAFGE